MQSCSGIAHGNFTFDFAIYQTKQVTLHIKTLIAVEYYPTERCRRHRNMQHEASSQLHILCYENEIKKHAKLKFHIILFFLQIDS